MFTRKILVVVSKRMENAYRGVFDSRSDIKLFLVNNLNEALDQSSELKPSEVIIHGKPCEVGFLESLIRLRKNLPDTASVFLLDSQDFFQKYAPPKGIILTNSDKAIIEILKKPSPSMKKFIELSAELGF